MEAHRYEKHQILCASRVLSGWSLYVAICYEQIKQSKLGRAQFVLAPSFVYINP